MMKTTTRFAAALALLLFVSLVMTMLMFALFPSRPTEPAPPPRPVLPAAEVDRRALILTVITGSYAVAYFSFGWTNVHTPIYIAIAETTTNPRWKKYPRTRERPPGKVALYA